MPETCHMATIRHEYLPPICPATMTDSSGIHRCLFLWSADWERTEDVTSSKDEEKTRFQGEGKKAMLDLMALMHSARCDEDGPHGNMER